MKLRNILLAVFVFFMNCTKTNKNEMPDNEQQDEVVELSDEVVVYNQDKVSNNLVLVEDLDADKVFLVEKDGTIFFEWTLSNELGNDVFLEDDGKLLALLHSDDDKITFGGYGGQIQLINPDSSIDWQFIYSTEDYNLHHDIERLPNGNIIALLWERKTFEEAQLNGFAGDDEIFIESVIEINPNTNEIVWKWSSWDHLIQDYDVEKANFGVVESNPQLININSNDIERGDIMHANSIEYDVVNDLIYISVSFYNEVWVIDHSTTTEQATSNLGGNYNKGGDLVYRFGNPVLYDSSKERLFYTNHHCNIIKQGLPGEGNILIFNNGVNFEQSTVYELELPSNLDINIDPVIKWSFTDTALYSSRVSGAQRIANGNTLITEGDFGYWEVTEDKEIVWQYDGPGFYWRGYLYSYDSDAVNNLQ